MYGTEINENKTDNNWCIDSDEVEEWTLVDRIGKHYVFTSAEMNSMSDEDYDLIVKNLRVKRLVFKDIIPKD